MAPKTTPISEIYGPVIQGEGAVIGRPTIFVRTGGCDYHCSWCDSLYAVEAAKYKHTWRKLTAEEIMAEVEALAGELRPMFYASKQQLTPLVTLSGGNPAMHASLAELIDLGHYRGYQFAIETQGTLRHDWAAKLDHITLSPKPPSSGMVPDQEQLLGWLNMADLLGIPCYVKVVVFNEDDYEFARRIRNIIQQYGFKLYLQAGTSDPYGQTDTFEGRSIFRERILERTDWLSQKVIADRWYDVRVLPQMHALIYGAKRGV